MLDTLIPYFILGCEYSWSTEPQLHNVHSTGNVSLIAAAEIAAISFQKFQHFANILKLKFLLKTTYYTNRSKYVFPAINEV